MEKTLEKIHLAGLKFLVHLSLEETYATIAKEALKLVQADYCSIFLEEGGVFKRVYPYSTQIYRMKFQKKSFISEAFKTSLPVILDVKEVEKTYPLIKQKGIKSIIAIPLSYLKKTIGVLTLQSAQEGYFGKAEANALKLLGPLATLAIKKTQHYNEVKKALDTRDLFISMASHELRTPTTTIFGYAQLLYDKMKNKNTDESRWVKSLHAESYRLTLLIKDLLEINRIKSGKLQFNLKECSLREVIMRALDNFKFNYPDREIIFDDQLKTDKDTVVGDFDKLIQVLINLLDNAAKFSFPDTTIVLFLKQTDSHFIIQVKDEGRGIDKKDIPKVFEGFYRGGDINHSEGMGLGLFLAKNILEKHLGSIHIHSKLNKGTLVEVKLPKVKI